MTVKDPAQEWISGHVPPRAEAQATRGGLPWGNSQVRIRKHGNTGSEPLVYRKIDVCTLGPATPLVTTTSHHSGGDSLVPLALGARNTYGLSSLQGLQSALAEV